MKTRTFPVVGQTMCRTKSPYISFALILALLTLGHSNTARAQCTDIAEFTTTADATDMAVPFCFTKNVSVTITNANLSTKTYTLLVNVDPIPPTSTGVTNGIVYTGTTALAPGFVTNPTNFGAGVFGFTVTVEGETTAPPIPLSFMIRNMGTFIPSGGYRLSFTLTSPGCPPVEVTRSTPNGNLNHTDMVPPTGFNNLVGTTSGSLSQLITDQLMPTAANSLNAPMTAQALVITQDLTIDVNTTYAIQGSSSASHGKLLMMPGTRVIVPSGNTLFLTSMDMFSCTTLSRGLEVQAGGAIRLVDNYISDAEHGLLAQNGSLISVFGNTFENNKTGITMPGTPADQPPVGFYLPSVFEFRVNTFSTGTNNIFGGGMKLPYLGMSGLLDPAIGYAGMKLTNQNLTLRFGAGSFNTLANGIVSDGSRLVIRAGSSFTNIHEAVGLKIYGTYGFGIHHNGKGNDLDFTGNGSTTSSTLAFSNVGTAIYSKGANTTVINSRISNANIGIKVEKCQNRVVNINNNRMQSIGLTGVSMLGNLPLANGSQVNNNNITVDGNPLFHSSIAYAACVELYESSPPATLNTHLRITNNTLNLGVGSFGIRSTNGKFGLIQSNTINLTNPNMPTYKAIHVEGGKYHRVTDNLVNNTGGATNARGINVMQCPNGYFQCNTATAGFSRGMQFTSANVGANTKGNVLGGADIGLCIGDEGIMNAFIGPQKLKGNLWNTNEYVFDPNTGIGDHGAQNFGTANDSPFTYDGDDDPNPSGDPDLVPPNFEPPGWFTQASGTTEVCTTTSGDPDITGVAPDDVIKAIANGTLESNSVIKDAFKLVAQRQLYYLLVDGAVLNQGSEVSDFMQANQTGPIGIYDQIGRLLEGLYAISTSETNQLTGYDASIESKQVEYEDALANQNAQAAATKQGELNSLLNQRLAFFHTLEAARASAISSVQSANNSAPKDYLWEQNEATVNDLELKQLSQTAFSAGDWQDLEAIAAQCPISGGDAVYRARVLLAGDHNFWFDDFASCHESVVRKSPERVSTASKPVAVFPNPASDRLFISTSGQAATATLVNILGQVVLYEQTIEEDGLNVGRLQSGLYRLLVSFPDGHTATLPVVISR